MSSYKNHLGKNPLQNYEHLIIPVHLPTEEHWFVCHFCIINLCIYTYDSASFPENTYQSIFQTLKQKFIKRERRTLPPQQCTLLHEDNWEEKTPSCPKQTNEIDCGVYTCSLAKQYLSDCNSPMAYEGGDFRNEMVGNLLELAASNKCCGDCQVTLLVNVKMQKKCQRKRNVTWRCKVLDFNTATLLLLKMPLHVPTRMRRLNPQDSIRAGFERRPTSAKQPCNFGWNSPEGVYFLPTLGELLA